MDDERNRPARIRPRRRAWLALGLLVLVGLVFALARFGGLFDIERFGDGVIAALGAFSGTPFAPLLLVSVFCVGAVFAAPQFVLIGIAILAFGPVWGAFWAWSATLVSGSLTFWLGWFSGRDVLQRLTSRRLKRLMGFISRNALAASTLVRNIPAGPFLMVNMVFGAVRAPYGAYLLGLGVGSLPKILLVAFGAQAIQSALGGRTVLAGLAAVVALLIFAAGWLFIRHRRHKGEILSEEDA